MNPNDPVEIEIWHGTPSQWINVGTYLFCLVLAAGIVAAYFLIPELESNPLVLAGLIVPVLWALTRYIGTRCKRYVITSQRVKVTTGLLSRHTNEIELYRVRDYSVVEPFWLRLVGCGNIILLTSDRTNPQIVLHAVPGVTALKDEIRKYTEQMRQRRGVRDLEIDSPPPI